MLARNTMRSFNHSSVDGVTLIELLITIAIVAILASIVIPSYNGYTNKSRRTDAKIALAEAVKNMERCYVTHNQYNHASCIGYPASGADMMLSDEGHYKVVATTLTTTTYTLTASPLSTSPQNNDDHCKKFTLDSTGTKDATNSDCW